MNSLRPRYANTFGLTSGLIHPDILPGHLQTGGLPAFRSRLVLATTLSANYGIYGPAFELGENIPAKAGSEENLNSEKYEIKTWDLQKPSSLKPLITHLNQIRLTNPALQSNERLHFHPTDNPSLICYSKRTADGSNLILAVVNLDSFFVQTGWVNLDLDVLGLGPSDTFEVYDLLADHSYAAGKGREIMLPCGRPNRRLISSA